MPHYDYFSADDCDNFGARVSNAQLIECLEQRVNALVSKGLLPGAAIGIVSGNEIELEQSYGVRDCSGNPMTNNTVFQLGELSQVLAVGYHAYNNSLNLQNESTYNQVVCFDRKVIDYGALPNPPSDLFCQITFADIYSQITGFRKDADGVQQLAGYSAEEILALQGNADKQAVCEHEKPIKYWYEDQLFRNAVARNNATNNQATQVLSNFWGTGDLQTDLTAYATALGLTNTTWGQANYLAAPERALGMQNSSCRKDNIVWECLYDFYGDNLMAALGANSTVTDLVAWARAFLGATGSPFNPCVIDDIKRARFEQCQGDLAMALGFKRRTIRGRQVYVRSAILPTGSRAFIALDFCSQFAFVMLSPGLTAYPEGLFIYVYMLFSCKSGRAAWKWYKKWVKIFSKRLCCDFCIPDLPCRTGCSSDNNDISYCLEGKFQNDMFGQLLFSKNETTGDPEVVYGPADRAGVPQVPVPISFGRCKDTFWFTWTDVNGMPQCVKGIVQRDFCERIKSVNVYLNCKDITFSYVSCENNYPCPYPCKDNCEDKYKDCWFDDGYDTCHDCRYAKCYGEDCADDVCFEKNCDDVCGKGGKCGSGKCGSGKYGRRHDKYRRGGYCGRKDCGRGGCDDCCYDSRYNSDDCCDDYGYCGGRGCDRKGCRDCGRYDSDDCCKPCRGWPKMYWAYGSHSSCYDSCSSDEYCRKKPCGKDRCQKFESCSDYCQGCGQSECCCDNCDRFFKGVMNSNQVIPVIASNGSYGEISGELNYIETKMKLSVEVCNLSEDPVSVIVYQGAVGAAGTAVKTLTNLSRRGRSSKWCSSTVWADNDTTDLLTPVLIQAARNGELYIEVETASGPVVRGQIRMCVN